MSDTHKLENSARRHLRAAEELLTIATSGAQPGCNAVAGYLFGLAGELAIKQMMLEAGIKQLPPDQKRQDPYFAHFPQLYTLLDDQLTGRRSEPLRKLVQTFKSFGNWSTDMRYQHTTYVSPKNVANWQNEAQQIVARMGAQ